MLIVVAFTTAHRVEEPNALFPPLEALLAPPSRVTNVSRWPCRAFQGRTQLLEDLLRQLKTEPVLALSGPAGVGKSQMALAMASLNTYQLVWWLRADTPEVFEAGCAALGRRLRAAELSPRSHAEDVASARAWLESNDDWLLIVDDVPDPALVTPMLPEGNGHVLITSRSPFSQPGGKNFAVPVLGAYAATEFLLQRTGATDSANAGRVAATLGFLPLALELAGAFVEQYGTFGTYYKLLMAQDPGLAGQTWPFDHERAATAACRISLARVRATSPAATELVRLCAFLAPDELPLESLVRGLGPQPAALRKAVSSNRLDEAIGVLWRLSLLERQSYGTWMHRGVQTATRAELPAVEQRTWSAAAVDALRRAFPADPDDVAAAPEFDRLLPHVFAAADLARGLGVEPAATSWLYHQVGRYHRSRSELARARASIEQSLVSAEAAYGPQHPTLAALLNDLGGVLRDLGALAAARACFERALAIYEAAYGPGHPDVVATVDYLAQVLHQLGDLAGARAGYERVLAIDLATYGPDHPAVGDVIGNLAGVLRDQGELIAARAWYERAIAIDQAAYGAGHPAVADGLINLAGVLRDMGEMALARHDFERALGIYEAAYGAANPSVAEVIKKLAGMLRDMGDLAGAQAGFERALAIEEAAVGPNHPIVAGLANNLAVVRRDRGDLLGAQAGFERALAIEEEAFGPGHPEVALVVDNLALALQDLGDFEGARAGFERALAIDEACFGRDHAEASLVAAHLAALDAVIARSTGQAAPAPAAAGSLSEAATDVEAIEAPGVGEGGAVAPAVEAAAPGVEAAPPAFEGAASAVEAAAPGVEAAAPGVEAAAPAVEAAAPAVDAANFAAPPLLSSKTVEIQQKTPTERAKDSDTTAAGVAGTTVEPPLAVEVVTPDVGSAAQEAGPVVEAVVEAAAQAVPVVGPAVEPPVVAAVEDGASAVDVAAPAAELEGSAADVAAPAVEPTSPVEPAMPVGMAAAKLLMHDDVPRTRRGAPREQAPPPAAVSEFTAAPAPASEAAADLQRPEPADTLQPEVSVPPAQVQGVASPPTVEVETPAPVDVIPAPADEPAPVAAPTPDPAAATAAPLGPSQDQVPTVDPAPAPAPAAAADDALGGEPTDDEVLVIEHVVELARMLERMAEAPPTIETSGPPRRTVPMVIDAASIELKRREQPSHQAPDVGVQQAGEASSAAAASAASSRRSGYRARRRNRGTT